MIASPGSIRSPVTIASSFTSPTQAPTRSNPVGEGWPLITSGSCASSPPGISIPASSAPAFRPSRDRAQHLRVRLLDRDVVHQRDRLGADADQVVHVHRDAVDPDRVEPPELLGDDHLRADAVGGQREPGLVVEPQHVGVVARAHDGARRPAGVDRPEHRHERLHGRVGLSRVHAGLGVCALAHGPIQADRAATRPERDPVQPERRVRAQPVDAGHEPRGRQARAEGGARSRRGAPRSDGARAGARASARSRRRSPAARRRGRSGRPRRGGSRAAARR